MDALPASERLYRLQTARACQLERLRAEAATAELAGCSFAPQLRERKDSRWASRCLRACHASSPSQGKTTGCCRLTSACPCTVPGADPYNQDSALDPCLSLTMKSCIPLI